MLPTLLTLTLVLTAVAASLLQELVALGAAWAAGMRDERMAPLARSVLRRSATPIGWLALPLGLALLTQLQWAALPVWAYAEQLFTASLTTPQERRRWVLVQLAIVPVLVLLAALVSLLLPLASGSGAVVLGTVVKQLLLLALLHLIPVPPFALGRALPQLWRDRRMRAWVQGILLAALLADGLTGGRVVGSTLGLLVDLVVFSLRLLG